MSTPVEDRKLLLRASGAVNVAVYPWEVSLGSTTPDDSRMNHVTGAVVSVAQMGNRTRVRVGPIVAEITAAGRREKLAALEWSGGVYSSEWGFSKLLHWLRHNPAGRARMATALEELITAFAD